MRSTSMRGARLAGLLAVLCALAACGERPQEMHASGKDQPAAWTGTDNGFAAPGWKAGDVQAWDQQLRRRNQGQNEYARIGGTT